MSNNPNPNQNMDPLSELDTPERENLLKNYPVTAFNMSGFTPISSRFSIPINLFCEASLKIARKFIPDFSEVSFESGNNGHIAMLLWIPANSQHLVNRSVSNNTMLRGPIRENSPKMKEFKKRFCRMGIGPEIRDPAFRYGEIIGLDRGATTDRREVALVVNPAVFGELIFDTDGKWMKIALGRERPIGTRTQFDYGYRGKMLSTIEVTKYLQKASNDKLQTKQGIRLN